MDEISFIGIDHFLGKEIVHVVGEGKNNHLSSNMYKSLKMGSVQCNRFYNFRSEQRFKKVGVDVQKLPQRMLKRGYPYGASWDELIKHADHLSYAELVLLAKGSGKRGRGWPTTGILAIDFALCKDHPDEVYLFGFDLYAKDYLVKKNAKHHSGGSPKSRMMFYHLRYLVEEFNSCRFFCASRLGINSPNWISI